jgi:hypothetical protein
MEHNPSKIIPPTSAEAANVALAKAVFEVGFIRSGADRGKDICAGDVADAFEAILDLVAPHWRMAQEDKR